MRYFYSLWPYRTYGTHRSLRLLHIANIRAPPRDAAHPRIRGGRHSPPGPVRPLSRHHPNSSTHLPHSAQTAEAKVLKLAEALYAAEVAADVAAPPSGPATPFPDPQTAGQDTAYAKGVELLLRARAELEASTCASVCVHP